MAAKRSMAALIGGMAAASAYRKQHRNDSVKKIIKSVNCDGSMAKHSAYGGNGGVKISAK